MHPSDTPQREPTIINLEETLWVLQRLHPVLGQWQNRGLAIRGRTAAYKVLNQAKSEDPQNRYRAIQKTSADDYQQGYKHGIELALKSPETAALVARGWKKED